MGKFDFICLALGMSLLVCLTAFAQADDPIVAMPIEGMDDWTDEIQWFHKFQANAAFLKRSDQAKQRRYRGLGFGTVAMPPTLSRNARRGRSQTAWITSYLKSRWQTKASRPLQFALNVAAPRDNRLEGMGYVFAAHLPRERTLFVQHRRSRAFVPSSHWTYDGRSQQIVLHDATVDEQYRVVFLCGERFRRDKMNVDGIPPAGRKMHMQMLDRWLQRMPELTTVRATSLNYSFSILDPPPDRPAPFTASRSWYGYQRTTTIDRLDRFRQRFGYDYPLQNMIDSCYLEEGFVPSEDDWRWIDLVREDMRGYALDYSDRVHRAGKRLRWFWGDQWIGVEPYLGDVDAAGIEEVTTALQGAPGRVRDLMAFPGQAKRLARFTLARGPTLRDEGRHAARVRADWRRWKREILYACPDGLEFLAMPRGWLESAAGQAYVDVAHDFRRVHRLTHGLNPHQSLTIYVLNAWGPMRSWGRFAGYASRDIISAMVDWPADVKWLSFREVVNTGIPADCDVVVVAGEAGTAFAGEAIWKDGALAERIREFVSSGGGLFCAGGAGLLEEQLKLGDLLGVEYVGAATQHAEQRLWNENRWIETGRSGADYRREEVTPDVEGTVLRNELPPEVEARFAGDRLLVTRETRIHNESALPVVVSPTGEPLGTIHHFGRGRTAYLAGYTRDARWLKVLLFYLADRCSALDQLDCPDQDVPVYYYPEGSLLVAFNATGDPVRTRIRFDPKLAAVTGLRVRLEDADTPQRPPRLVTAEQLRDGLPIALEGGEAVYWRVREQTER